MEHETRQSVYPLLGDGQPLEIHVSQTNLHASFRRMHTLPRILTFLAAMAGIYFLCMLATLLCPLLLNAHWQGLLLSLPKDVLFGCASFTISGESLPPEFLSVPDNLPENAPDKSEATPQAPPPETNDLYPIAEADLSCGGNPHALSNETTYTPDTQALLAETLPFVPLSTWRGKYSDSDPYILILHTHATEAYTPEDSLFYSASNSFRSREDSENMIAVGQAMQAVFENAGIPVLHCTEQFDAESYRDSYRLAAATIRACLEEHPSIQVVLDVHRDSIIQGNLTSIRPLTTVDGKETAQIMMVVGTDFKGANHPNWKNNLNFALKIQDTLMQRESSLCRAINLRGAGFNEQYTSGSLLLEIGSCGNTLQQAKRAGEIAAQAISLVIRGENQPNIR